jgi:hypothetical protein
MQLHDRSVIHRFLPFARPCGVEPQAEGTTIGGADEAPLRALMVAQSAAEPAGADFDAAGKPARYENFHFTVHRSVPVGFNDSFVSRLAGQYEDFSLAREPTGRGP